MAGWTRSAEGRQMGAGGDLTPGSIVTHIIRGVHLGRAERVRATMLEDHGAELIVSRGGVVAAIRACDVTRCEDSQWGWFPDYSLPVNEQTSAP